MVKLNVFSYNVRGLGDEVKRRQVFHYLHCKKVDIVFFQELHSTEMCERRWSTEWGSKFWFSHGTSKAAGAGIAFSRELLQKIKIEVHNVNRIEGGRGIILYLTMKQSKWIFANIYAPNKDDPDFFKGMFDQIHQFNPDYILVGGDLNTGLDPRLDRRGTIHNNDKAAKFLEDHLSNNNISDIWRILKPDEPGYTWRRLRPTPAFSRLDYFFITDSAMQFVEDIKILPGFRTDHSIISLALLFDRGNRGPGYWKFNTALLSDHDFVDKLNKTIEVEIDGSQKLSRKQRWESLKLAIRNSAIQYAINRKKSNKNKLDVLERKLERLEKEQVTPSPLFEDTETQIRLVKQDIQNIMKIKTMGAITRCRMSWELLAERPTKYFLNLEKIKYNNKTIHRLVTDEDIEISEPGAVLQEIRAFYDKLYTTKGYCRTDYIDKLEIPKISEEDRQTLDSKIELPEVSLALKELANNKCPGTDGLPADLYKMFWSKIKLIYFEALQQIVEDSCMHLTARQGILSLMEKPGKSHPLKLTGWRPLTLLNVDGKIYTKIMAMRLQKMFPKIIHHTQTGFVKGRMASESILKLQQIIDKCNETRQDGIIISFDFYKAFDCLEWESIFAALKAFNFGEEYIKMVQPIFSNPQTFIINNGFWADPFFPTRGARQGCCFSPIIFDLVVELLSLGIRQNDSIEGIKLENFGKEIKMGQFADDLWSALKTNCRKY